MLIKKRSDNALREVADGFLESIDVQFRCIARRSDYRKRCVASLLPKYCQNMVRVYGVYLAN